MRFSKDSASGQAAIEFVLIGAMLIVAAFLLLTLVMSSGEPENDKGSIEFEQTRAGTIEGKYIDSADYGKHYYVTVMNNGYEADHEVSLAEYNAAQVGDDFPIVLPESDSVKSDEAQEEAEAADAAKSQAQAAEQQQRQSMLWWLMNHQMLMNMSSSSN